MVEMFKSIPVAVFMRLKHGHLYSFSLQGEWIAVQLAQFPLSIISSTLVHVTVLLK